MKPYTLLFFVFALFSGCIGTDFVDDPLVEGGPMIVIESEAIVALMLNEQLTVLASYQDEYGIERNVPLQWETSNAAVATVSNGVITAVGPGQADIVASYEEAFAGVAVNVVMDNNSVAKVTIGSPATTSLMIGSTSQLSASVQNIQDMVLAGKPLEWFSENSAIVTVTQQGLVTAVGNGIAEVHAKSEGVKSNSIVFMVGVTNVRTGTFQGAGGYSAKGTVTVMSEGNKLIVQLSSDFSASIAAGTFIYLANSTSGGIVKSNGLELGQYTATGTKTFEANGVSLTQYSHVVVLCKPFGITFGFAQLQP
jgi:hypothetical protein